MSVWGYPFLAWLWKSFCNSGFLKDGFLWKFLQEIRADDRLPVFNYLGQGWNQCQPSAANKEFFVKAKEILHSFVFYCHSLLLSWTNRRDQLLVVQPADHTRANHTWSRYRLHERCMAWDLQDQGNLGSSDDHSGASKLSSSKLLLKNCS